MIDTRERILDTAEKLIGEQGYAATSLRQIIAEAGVNLAAVHYHFGSKEHLLDEVVLRKSEPVNQERIARLDLVEASGEPLSVERVLEAFMAPMSETADQNPQFVRLMGRMHAEGLMPGIVERHFQPAIGRFLTVMRKALPGLPEEEFLWRIHFMIGAMAHTMCGAPDYTRVSGVPGSFRERIDRLVAFLSAGFRAPVPRGQKIEVE
ncbi:MAG: TetR family transcriptional regulator [Acidobacteriia bacterium]|nr:TetR family transcriptional regulator [Terriglobia bacterium]